MDGKKLMAALLLPVLALVQLLFSSAVFSSSDKELLLDKLYNQTGLERQLDWVHDSMTLQQTQLALPDNVVDTVNQMVELRYSADYFRSSMKSTLDEALSMGELARLIRWYESPLGKKIRQLETMANDPNNQAAMEHYLEERLSQEEPRSDRVQLIDELMQAFNTVDLSTELAASASVGAQRMLEEVMPTGINWSMRPAQIAKAQEKPYIRTQMLDRMRKVYLYTYRTLPDYEIQQYIKFAKEKAMQKFQRGQILAIAKMF